MKEKSPLQKPRVVKIVRSDYQPSKAELEEDMSIDAPFEDVMQAVIKPVTIQSIPRPKQE